MADKVLRIGDVVLLNFTNCPQEGLTFTPTLAQGLEGPITDLPSFNELFAALFQIVPYIPRVVDSDQKQLEYCAYQDEVKDIFGKDLVYGADISFKHVFSGQLLYVDIGRASDQINTWKVSVGRAESITASTLVRLSPRNNSSEDKKSVASGAGVNLDFISGRISLSLCVSRLSNVVHCSTQATSVNLYLYDDDLASSACIKFLYPVTIRHSKLGEYLTYDPLNKRLELRTEPSLDANWVCKATDANGALVRVDNVVRFRHAFYPVYMLQSGGIVSASEEDEKCDFAVVPCFQGNDTIGDGSSVYIQCEANKRLTVPRERMDEFLLTKFLPYPASLDTSKQAVTQVEIIENATDLIFEISNVSDEKRRLYMELKTMLAAYEHLAISLTPGTADVNSPSVQSDLKRVLMLEGEIAGKRNANQKFSEMLVSFCYHEYAFQIIYALATLEVQDTALITTLIKSLKSLLKGNARVADFISSKTEQVKDLISKGHWGAGKLYCAIIKEGQNLPMDVKTFCLQWFEELSAAGEDMAKQKSLYLKILISACKSESKDADQCRECVAELLEQRELIQVQEVEGASRLEADSARSEFLSRALLLYSAVYLNIEKKSHGLLARLGFETSRLSELVRVSVNKAIKKACGVLRAKVLIQPSQRFLEVKDHCYLYDLTMLEINEISESPYSIGTKGLSDMSADVWNALVAQTCDLAAVKAGSVESLETLLESLLEQVTRARALLNECMITPVYLHCLRVSMAAAIWAMGCDAGKPAGNPLKIFTLLRYAVKSNRKAPSAKLETLLNAIFQGVLSLYHLASRIRLHRTVDELILGLKDVNKPKPSMEEIKAVLERDEIGRWQLEQKTIREETLVDKDFEADAEVGNTLSAINDFDTANNLDRTVIQMLLKSPFVSALKAEARGDYEALLLMLFYPKRTIHRCIKQSVIVKAFSAMKVELSEVVARLEENMSQEDILNAVFKGELIKVCNLLLSQVDSSEFRKTQAIMRNLQLHSVLAPYIMCASESREESEIRTLCATFMYRFVSGNKMNREALLKVLTKPVQFWETRQFVSFITETVDLYDMRLGDIYKMTKRVLTDLLNSNSIRYSPHLMTGLLFDREHQPYSDRQNVLSRLLLVPRDYDQRQTAIVFKLLASCSRKNEPVVSQCRVFCPLERLASLVAREYDPVLLLEYLSFLQEVYLQQFDNSALQIDTQRVPDILRTVWNRAYPFTQDAAHFRELCESGRYITVRCFNNPYKLELAFSQNCPDSFLAAWNLILSGKTGDRGLLTTIDAAGKLLKRDTKLLDFFSEQLLYDLQSLEASVRDMQMDFDVSVLLKAIESAARIVEGVLGNPSKPVEQKLISDPNFLMLLNNVKGAAQLFNKSGQKDEKQLEGTKKLKEIAEDLKHDEKYDVIVQNFAADFAEKFGTKNEISEVVKVWKFGSWAQSAVKIEGLKRLLYKSHRVWFFRILRDIAATSEAASIRSELLDVGIRNGLVDIAIESILKGATVTVQCTALQFLTTLVTDLSESDFEKLKLHLESTRKVNDLFLLFYEAIAEMTATLQSTPFQSKAAKSDQLSMDEPSLICSGTLHMFSTTIDSPADAASTRTSHFIKRQSALVSDILKFIRTACDNLNSTWQRLFYTQSPADAENDQSIDILTEITKLVAALGRYPSISLKRTEVRELLLEGINALIELTTGSENTNSLIVSKEVSLFPALNSLFEEVFKALRAELAGKPRAAIQNYAIVVEVLQALSQLLLTLTECGEMDYTVFRKYLRLDMLLNRSNWIYTNMIHGRRRALELGIDWTYEKDLRSFANLLKDQTIISSEDFISSADLKISQDLVASAILLRIFLVKMSKLQPCPASLLTLEQPITSAEKDAEEFYKKYTGQVEITDNNQKHMTMYFPIPFKCFFLTYLTYEKLIMRPADKQHDENLEALLKEQKLCKWEMDHQQKLSRNEMQKIITGLWQLYGQVSIILLVIINALMIIYLEGDEILGHVDESAKHGVLDYLRFFGFLQLLMGVSSYVCHFIEYLPENTQNLTETQTFSFQEFCGQQDNASLLQFERLHKQSQVKETPTDSKMRFIDFIMLCLRLKSFYFIFYLSFSLMGLIWYIAYPVLLLDCIRRFGSLSRLLQAITNTWEQLLITLAFETIIVYIFSVVGFMLFQDYYKDADNVLNCTTLFECMLSTMKTGLTQGGIGGELEAPSAEQYWDRMTFDLLFWALAIVVMLNITFGIIIDSYSGLREEYRLMIERKESECFICGDNRSNIESRGEAWETHIQITHPLISYISLCVYLSEKEDKACSGLEKTVKNKIAKYDTSFFPRMQDEESE